MFGLLGSELLQPKKMTIAAILIASIFYVVVLQKVRDDGLPSTRVSYIGLCKNYLMEGNYDVDGAKKYLKEYQERPLSGASDELLACNADLKEKIKTLTNKELRS